MFVYLTADSSAYPKYAPKAFLIEDVLKDFSSGHGARRQSAIKSVLVITWQRHKASASYQPVDTEEIHLQICLRLRGALH